MSGAVVGVGDEPTGHIDPSKEAWRAFVDRGIDGPVVMLNLLRFREVADYGEHPDLEPDEPVSGRAAFAAYSQSLLPLLEEVGGEVVFRGEGGRALIGPADERWDVCLLVRYPSPEAFGQMTRSEDYLAVVGHRVAALEDSRLLPIEPAESPAVSAQDPA